MNQYVRDGVIRLHHFTRQPMGEGFTTDPTLFGKNPWTRAEAKANGAPKTFFYVDPDHRKLDRVAASEHYVADYPAERIYDADADPQGHKERSFNVGVLLQRLHDAGYHGLYYSGGGVPTVALWHPVPVTRAGTEPTKLARQVHGAPAGGMIVNNRFARGGQFMERTRARIRDVASRIVKLARPVAGETHTAAALFGRSPHAEPAERPFTLGELKAVEAAHGLPETQRLSPKVSQPDGARGDEHPFAATTDHIRKFITAVSQKAIPAGGLRKVLSAPLVPDGVKLLHLVANMKGDHAASRTGTSWYHGQVNELERRLHALAGGKDHPLWGSMDPATGELKGKHDAAENHPGVVLFKAVLAATSGSSNPDKNTLAAAKLWSAGRRRNGGAGHPILDAPDYDHDTLEDYVRRLVAIHGSDHEAAIRAPGTTRRERAQWYNAYVAPHADELGDPGYSGSDARINPDHTVVWEDTGDTKERGDGKEKRGVSLSAVLPLVDSTGRIKPKGWGTRSAQIAGGLASLKGLFLVAREELGPDATEAQQFRYVAKWLLSDHEPKELDAMGARVRKYKDQLPALTESPFNGRKHAQQGWFDKGEAVPGMFVLGPKFGAFGMNLNSNDASVASKYRRFLTADLWFTRNWARYLGNLHPKGSDPFEAPKSRDRREMKAAVKRVCDELGVTPADLQADLWYHEQALYRMLGADPTRTESLSYADVARKHFGEGSRFKLARALSIVWPGETAHEALTRLLGARESVRHGRTAVVYKMDGGDIGLDLHGSRIVTAHPNGQVTFNHHGYMTPTTRRFMAGFGGHDVSFAGGKLRVNGTEHENNTPYPPTPAPAEPTYTTVPHDDPELRNWWGQVYNDGEVDHTAAKGLADRLEERGDWRHTILGHTTGGMSDRESVMHPTRVVHHPDTAEWSHGVTMVLTGSPQYNGGVRLLTGLPLPDGSYRYVGSLHTPEQYETIRRAAATAGVHFPQVTHAAN